MSNRLQDGEFVIWSGDDKKPSTLVLRLDGKEYRADLIEYSGKTEDKPSWRGKGKLRELTRKEPAGFAPDNSERIAKVKEGVERLYRDYR